MIRQDEHGKWYVKGTSKFWATKAQAEKYDKGRRGREARHGGFKWLRRG